MFCFLFLDFVKFVDCFLNLFVAVCFFLLLSVYFFAFCYILLLCVAFCCFLSNAVARVAFCC